MSNPTDTEAPAKCPHCGGTLRPGRAEHPSCAKGLDPKRPKTSTTTKESTP